MPAIRSSLLVTAACAALAVPAFAAAQTYEVPTSGSGTGYDWTTFPLGPKDSPSTITTAFGLLWLPDSTTGSGQVSTVDPTTGAVTAQYAPVGAPRVSGALAQGNYVWLAGPRSQGARVIAVDQTGTTRLTFNGPTKSTGWAGDYGGVGLAYGAGAIWVSDQSANKVYAISPTTAKLVRTISVKGPRSVAVSGKTVWVTNASAGQVTVFSASTGKRLAVGSAKTDPTVMAASGNTMWAFGENVITGFNLKTFKQAYKVTIPGMGGRSGWAGVVSGPGGLWVSNLVASVILFNPTTRAVTTNVSWSNSDFAGSITSANGSLWVADGSMYAFPLGYGVTRITPTPAPAA